MSERNVLGEPLQPCCDGTGFTRNGFCQVPNSDRGNHSVCAVVTDEFLQMQARLGNDLITPIPAYQFPGLKAGDRWCLCASRWKQAYDHGLAPQVDLRATSEAALQIVTLDALKTHSIERQ